MTDALTLLLAVNIVAAPGPDFGTYKWALVTAASQTLPEDVVDDVAFDAKGTA